MPPPRIGLTIALAWLCAVVYVHFAGPGFDAVRGALSSMASFCAADLQLKLAAGAVSFLPILYSINYVNTEIYDNPLGRTFALFYYFGRQESTRNINVDQQINKYNELHDGSVDDRNTEYATLVDNYYELSTSFYEWGWGQSFHFAYRLPGENFDSSIKRHEYYIASLLNVKEGDRVLDCGCGIGGPMRNITRFTRANVTGVTISDQQVKRGNELNKRAGLFPSDGQQHTTAVSMQADFTKLTEVDPKTFMEDSFDAVYAIEATCHAPRREDVYAEIFKVLKPGGRFACYEWCLTDRYEPGNSEHAQIKKQIEEGDALPDMTTCSKVVEALESVGFNVVLHRDCALDDGQVMPWYLPLVGSWNPFSFRFNLSPPGMFITRHLLKICEFLHLVPAGTSKIQTMLQQGGIGCANGGLTGTFTPMMLMVGEKPLDT